jgi:hypothetical protein
MAIIIENPHDNVSIISDIIKRIYPKLEFKILHMTDSSELYFNQHLHSPGFPKKIF